MSPSPPVGSGGLPVFRPAETPDELGRLGVYRILRLLGGGGMGMVFMAEDTTLGRHVALKMMRPELSSNPSAHDRFLREARAAAAIHHDNITPIFQVGTEGTTSFLAMPLLQGESLESWVRREHRGSPAQCLRIGREIAQGLSAAHDRGLIHRDIKPGNIWLEAPNGRVKLLDFGLARGMSEVDKITQSGRVLGTPHFMAPEQARGDPLDHRCDLFSLGVVMFVLATGEFPFRGSTAMALAMELATVTPPSVRDLNADIPAPYAALVVRLLEKDPAQRPGSAAEVVALIQAAERDLGFRPEDGWTSLPTAPPPDPAVVLPHSDQYFPPTDKGTPARGPVTRAYPDAPPTQAAVLTPWSLPPGTDAGQSHPTAGHGSSPLRDAGLLVMLAGLIGAVLYLGLATRPPPVIPPAGQPIHVGILHSRTGTMAISEKSVIEATQFAIDEINDAGGILGRKVISHVADGESHGPTFAHQAEELIRRDKVSVIFGCWTSASRKAVKKVVEQYDSLLFYPVQYEGVEQSPNIIYTGATPNQQILPAVSWAYAFLKKKRAYLIGSDYVFPVVANQIIRDEYVALGGTVVGEAYFPLGSSTGLDQMVTKIVEAKPDVIFNTINGDSNVAFFRALRAAGVRGDTVPTISFSISEEELSSLRAADVVGEYAAWNYFETVDRPQNHRFVKEFRTRYPSTRAISDPMEAAYFGVHLWAQAVAAAEDDEPRKVRGVFTGFGGRRADREARTVDPREARGRSEGLTFDAPGCLVRVDPSNQHTAKIARIGRINEQGQFRVIYSSDSRLDPVPYPPSRSEQEWKAFLTNLYHKWGDRWDNPGDPKR